MMDHEHTLTRWLRHMHRRAEAIQRAVLELRVAGWTYEQIADALGFPNHDAASMVQYAVEKGFEHVIGHAHDWPLLERAVEEQVEDERDDDRAADHADHPERRHHRAHADVRAAALQRAALELRMAEWTYEQIATALGVSEHEVFSMVHGELTKRSEHVSELAHRKQRQVIRKEGFP